MYKNYFRIIGLAYIFKLFYKHDLALNKSLLVSYISYIAKEINEPEIVNKHDGYKKIYDLNGECFGDLSAEDKYIVILMIHKDYIDINDVFDLNNFLILPSVNLIIFPINLTGCGEEYGSPMIRSITYAINITKTISLLISITYKFNY